jgi:hypothetical protein
MTERFIPDEIVNPRGLEHPVLVGAALGAVAAYAAGVNISTWLHRGTHGGVEFSDGAKKFWGTTNFFLTGMPKIDWADHLSHHEYNDRYDEEAHTSWNESRPEGTPEAPEEVFSDPYSPQREGGGWRGYLKVFFNTLQNASSFVTGINNDSRAGFLAAKYVTIRLKSAHSQRLDNHQALLLS